MSDFERTYIKQPLTIDDAFLIKWLKDNFNDIGFINQLKIHKLDTRERIDQLSKDVVNLDSGKSLYEQRKQVLKLWRNLVENAIVYLKSEDTRELYHDDESYGVEELYEFFKTLSDFESLLYGARPGYREHISHMFSVFLLGECLIRETFGFRKIDVGDAALPEGQKILENEKEAMWCIMALTHDLGIALQDVRDINPKARDMLKKFGIIDMQQLSYSFPRQPLHDFMLQLISSTLDTVDTQDVTTKKGESFTTHIQPKYFLKFAEAFERIDHGLVSCLVLMKNLVYFLETDLILEPNRPFPRREDAKQFLIRCNILRSIASHSCENIYYLTLPQFPFLLTIFDEMHEWGRPRFAELFEPRAPDTAVILEDLSEDAIHYKVQFPSGDLPLSEDEKKRMRREARQFFEKKCDKIRKILRSAVSGEERALKLTFEVSRTIGGAPINYKVIHTTPADVRIFRNDEEISWLQLLEKAQL